MFLTQKAKGASGPSGQYDEFWKKIAGSNIYGNVSNDLCHAIALMLWSLCIDEVSDPESLSLLMACRLIPLEKSPGVRPIGIGEVLRRRISKVTIHVVKPDILRSTSYDQFCAG